MDELKLKLSTKFMRGIIAKLISKALYKKFGWEINVLIDEIEMTTIGDKVKLHIKADAETSKEEFMTIVKSFDAD